MILIIGRIKTKFSSVISLTALINIQLTSYDKFLQRVSLLDGKELNNQGLQEVFLAIFPIESSNGELVLEYVNYTLDEANVPLSEAECKKKGTAIGIALGHRLDGKDNYTYLILGDGECDEGQIWEGALFAHHHKLSHLITFIDNNKKQLDGYTKDINDLGNIGQKFASFGWHAQNVDGSDVAKIYEVIEKAKEVNGQPSVIILDTIKGQGLKFVEDTMANHHMRFSDADNKAAEKCIVELENSLKEYQVSY